MIPWIHTWLPLPFPFVICTPPQVPLSEALKLLEEKKHLKKKDVEALKKVNKEKPKKKSKK